MTPERLVELEQDPDKAELCAEVRRLLAENKRLAAEVQRLTAEPKPAPKQNPWASVLKTRAIMGNPR
ncbi:MAG TPA: hypothetical protein VHR66_24290 [Gemmataceae bacterium]|nr:hypothetical protein [Gemmataceae bacterium]